MARSPYRRGENWSGDKPAPPSSSSSFTRRRAIAEAITTLAEAEERFHLTRTEDEAFFLEWCTDLPELADAERSGLVEVRHRYLYQRSQGHLLVPHRGATLRRR